MAIFYILDSIYNVLLFTAMVVGIVKFKKLSKPLRFVFLFVVFGCLTEITIESLKEFGMRNTSPVGNIYFPVALLILGLFYIYLFKDYINKKVIIGLIFVFELLCVFNLVFIQDLLKFPNIIAAIGALLIIVFSVLQLSKVMSEAKIKKLSAEPVIWINTAFLIYYSANFFYFILFNLNLELDIKFARQVHNVYAGLNILLYTLIAIGFVKVKSDNHI